MKKTLIALMALSGGAMAAANSPTAFINATGDSVTPWELSNLTYTVNDDGDMVFAGSDFIAKKVGSRTVTSIAFTLDLSQLTLPTSASRMITIDGSQDTGVGVTADGALTGTWTNTTAYYTTAASLVGTGEATFVYTLGQEGTRIYEGDVDVFWSSSNLRGDLGTINNLTVESWVLPALKNMTIWSETDLCIEVKDESNDAYTDNRELVSKVFTTVPEPTTATLSLLALAGLAARRRRK